MNLTFLVLTRSQILNSVMLGIGVIRAVFLIIFIMLDIVISGIEHKGDCDNKLIQRIFILDIALVIQLVLDIYHRKKKLNDNSAQNKLSRLITSGIATYAFIDLNFTIYDPGNCEKEFKALYIISYIRVIFNYIMWVSIFLISCWLDSMEVPDRNLNIPISYFNDNNLAVDPLPLYSVTNNRIANNDDENSNHSLSAESTCVICMESFDEEQTINRPPCGHIFHSDCLNQWLERSRSCPICRRNPYEILPYSTEGVVVDEENFNSTSSFSDTEFDSVSSPTEISVEIDDPTISDNDVCDITDKNSNANSNLSDQFFLTESESTEFINGLIVESVDENLSDDCKRSYDSDQSSSKN